MTTETHLLIVGRQAARWLASSGESVLCPPQTGIPIDLANQPEDWVEQVLSAAPPGVVASSQPIYILLESDLLLSSSLGRQRPLTNEQLLISLEDQLPIQAENWVATTWDHVAIAVHAQPLASYLAQLEERRVRILDIRPVATFVLDAALRQTKLLRTAKSSFCICQQGTQIEWFRLQSGRLVEWRSFSHSSPGMLLSGRMWLEDHHPQVVGLSGQLDSLDQWLAQAKQDQTHDVKMPEIGSRDIASAAIRKRGKNQNANLRLGQFAEPDPWNSLRRLERWALTSAWLSTICICVALVQLISFYQQKADTCAQRQTELYQQAFPGQPIPGGLVARWESELNKRRAITFDSGLSQKPLSVLPCLHRFLAAIPVEIRFQLDRIELRGDSFRTSGTVRQHTDAGRLVAGWGNGGFDVPAPRTEQTGTDRVQWEIEGRLPTSITSDSSTSQPRPR